MTPEMQKKRDELAKKYGKDVGGNEVCHTDFCSGFIAAHDLMQEKVKPLVEAAWCVTRLSTRKGVMVEDMVYEVRLDDMRRLIEALKGWESE